MMTNEEAIKIINHLPNNKPWEVEALAMAIKSLESQIDIQDCEHCIHTYGTLECCNMVDNELIYDCAFGKEQYKKEHESQRWIPCSERLPEEQNHYLITVKTDMMNGCKPYYGTQISWYGDRDNHFIVDYIGSHNGLVAKRSVIAWMQLPEPYKEVQDDE